MKSREEAEQAVNEALTNVASLFKILKTLKDSDREKMIASLEKASAEAPDYKFEQIKSVLKNLYFNRVKDNFNTKDFDVASTCGKKYLALYDAAAPKDKFQEQVEGMIVTMRDTYYQQTKHDFSKKEYANALKSAKKYLEISDIQPGVDEAKKKHELQGIMLDIHQKRANKINQQIRALQVPNVPATNIYKSMPVKIIPRTPTPLKVTQSLNTKFSKNRATTQSWSGVPSPNKPRKK